MLRHSRAFTVCFALVIVFALGADDTPKDKLTKPAPPTEPALKKPTHKVEKGPFKVELTIKGVFESEAMTEVLISPEAFTPENRGQLRVLKALPHGSEVRKGDQLLWLDMERIDLIIADLERDRELADLSFKLAYEDLYALEKTTPIDLANAERGKKLADEDVNYFLTDEKDNLTKTMNYYVKSSADYLTYAKEELQQLEKMYKSSDLTEATEQIILKRQRDTVEQAAFFLKRAENDRDHFFKLSLPRMEERLKESNIKQSLTLEKTKTTLPLLLNQKRLTLNRMKFERERTAEKLAKFKKDRDHMIVKAPAAGIVYYGKCVRGQWSSAMESRLQRGGNLMPDEVILTIVQPRPLFVRASVDEKDFGSVRAGMQGKVAPTMLPEVKLAARVEKVSTIQVTPGHFEAHVTLGDFKETMLMPGMGCSVKLLAYYNADALTVPAKAVFTDEDDEDAHYVYIQGKDDKNTKVNVTLGKKSGAKVEILQGLAAGDVILLEKPATDQKKEQSKKGS
jgi:HlyD family secretion protein